MLSMEVNSLFETRSNVLYTSCRQPRHCFHRPFCLMMLVKLREGQMTNDQNRRKFLGTAAATTAAFTIVPRHVLGGPGVVAPSDKITLGHIGVGTEGLREIQPLLA